MREDSKVMRHDSLTYVSFPEQIGYLPGISMLTHVFIYVQYAVRSGHKRRAETFLDRGIAPQKEACDMNATMTDEMDLDRLPALLECPAVAHILRITPRAVAYKCAKGELRAVKAGKGWRINRDDILRYATLR